MVRIVQPPGDRACRTGGEWEHARDDRGSQPSVITREQLFARFPSPEMEALFKRELGVKIRGAMAGTLTYGETSDKDVCLIAAHEDVLELRIGTKWVLKADNGKDEQFHVRLFFSEPTEVADSLVALRFFWKHPGPIDLADQTAQAGLASRTLNEYRSRNWC